MHHTVSISGLTPSTTYYYRAVSHASLAISTEHSFTTLSPEQASEKKYESSSSGNNNNIAVGNIGIEGTNIEEINNIEETEKVTNPLRSEASKTDLSADEAETNLGAAAGGFLKGMTISSLIIILFIILLILLFFLLFRRTED